MKFLKGDIIYASHGLIVMVEKHLKDGRIWYKGGFECVKPTKTLTDIEDMICDFNPEFKGTLHSDHCILLDRPPRKLMGKEPRLVQLGYDYYYRWKKGKWNILENLKEHAFNTDRVKNCRTELEAITAWNLFVENLEDK